MTPVVWVTWRQHRAQVLVTVAFLLVVGVLLLVHGVQTDALVDGATERLNVLGERFRQVATLLLWSAAVPALVGLFWGTPLLAREFERGTYLLAWTQSVSRRAWLGVKLVGLGFVVTVTGLVFGLVMYVWADEFAPLPEGGRLANPDLFVVTGIVPGAWWLFAFAVGAAAGAVLRRLLPAMAVTLAVFFLAYTGMFGSDVRMHYATPVHVEKAAPVVDGEQLSINIPSGAEAQLPAGALMVTSGWLDARDVRLSHDETWTCADTSDYLSCMRDKGYRWFADYQPADRYWRFQLTEAGLLLAASLALGAVAWRRAR